MKKLCWIFLWFVGAHILCRAETSLPEGAAYVTRWVVTVSHAPLGMQPSSVFARATTQIAIAFEKAKSDAKPQCYIAPLEVGYNVILLSNRPLSTVEKESYWALIKTKIKEAAETEHDRRDVK